MMAKEQCNALMNEGYAFAQLMLKNDGEFHPYAVTLTTDGSMTHVGATDGREFPPGADVLALLMRGLRAQSAAREIDAFGLFSRVVVGPDGRDAGRAELEHCDGYSVSVFLPYTLTEDGPTYGDLFAMAREPSAFPTG